MIRENKPDEFYNLAAQSFVKVSFSQPIYTTQVNSLGVLHLLESIRHFSPKTKYYQASTSEMYGNPKKKALNEKTEFNPVSPYAISKLYAYHMTKMYRDAYNLFCVNGILFNHESPFRGQEFVTQKIVTSLIKVMRGKQDYLLLGNLDSKRDWGHAKDFTNAMWLMLQQTEPQDFVISTGKSYTVRDFVTKTSKYLGLDIIWKGKGINEKAYNKKTGKVIVKVEKKFYRPNETYSLIGDPSKAKKILKWKPESDINDLIAEMCENRLKNF